MRHVIRFSCVAFIASFLFWGCNNDPNPISQNTKTDRLNFVSQQEFFDTYSSLSNMSREELDVWEQKNHHSSLLNSDDQSLLAYSDAFRTVLNTNSEFEIGDSIIWFYLGNLYAVSKHEEKKLLEIQHNPEAFEAVGCVEIHLVTPNNEDALNKVNLGFSGLDARNQYQFTQQSYHPCNGTWKQLVGRRKYVHEIYAQSVAIKLMDNITQINSQLYLRIKLEFRNSKGKWRAAGEHRNIDINVSGSAQLTSCSSKAISLNASFNCSGDQTIYLSSNSFLWPSDITSAKGVTNWKVSLNGTIYQHVRGDNNSNAWVNSGVLW
ncbi:MAG: hypothetical protein GXY77_02975 [Fibrobacter sp.]|nr:hypothetical protein [Fibrobacter sp.]